MKLDDVPAGESIFLDANLLVYHFAAHPVFGPPSTDLVGRVQNNEVPAFTSTHVLSEAAHHLMTFEASQQFGWTSKVVDRLKQDPTRIQQLSSFRKAIEGVPQFGIQVLTIPVNLVATAAALSIQYGLLTNDALVIAVMQANGLTNIASSDADFDRVAGLTRYAPT
jgi:predicted nucleic acid-binding protein